MKNIRLGEHNRNLTTYEFLLIYSSNWLQFFGIDVLLFSERLYNYKIQKWFKKFITKNSKVQVDYKLLKKLLKSRFKSLDGNELFQLREIYLNRMVHHQYYTNKHSIESSLLEFSIKMNIKELYSFSQFVSRLGLFSVSFELEEFAKSKLLSFGFNDFYSLLQYQKVLTYSQSNVSALMSSINTITFSVQNKTTTLLTRLASTNASDVDLDFINVMGPLREINSFDSKYHSVAITKPNKNEIDFLQKGSFKEVFLYTYNPIVGNKCKIMNNVIDYRYNRMRLFKKFDGDEIKFELNYLLINGYPQHIQRILLHQLFQVSRYRVLLSGVSFYTTNEIYSKSYSYQVRKLSEQTLQEKSLMVWNLGWHSLIANFRIIRLMLDKGHIELEPKLKEISKLSVREYARVIDSLYSSEK